MRAATGSDHPLWPRPSRLQEALAAGEDQLVLWIALDAPSVVEIAGAAGVDAVIIDLEHASFGVDAAERMTLAAEAAGMTALARPSRTERAEVGRLLDAGVRGIVFPMISSGDDAAAARAMLRFPPEGTRGWGGAHVRRARWVGPPGMRAQAYLDALDATVLSIFLVEDPAGVEAIDEILDRGRPDAVIFGWGDFGAAVGFDPDAALAAAERVYAACAQRGIGVARDPATALAPAHYPGCFTVAGVDSTIVAGALRDHVERLRSAS